MNLRASLKNIKRLHFTLLATCLANWVLEFSTPLGLNPYLEAGIEILTIGSGLLICFYMPHPFKSFNIYYYSYAAWLVAVSLSSILKGSFSALILLLFLNPIWPDRLEANLRGGIRIYDDAHGFLSRCCPYLVTEDYYYLFEKEVTRFELEEPYNPKNIEYQTTRNGAQLVYRNKQDSLMVVEL